MTTPSATIRRSISPRPGLTLPNSPHLSMKQVRRTLPRLLRLMALTALLSAGVAHANDYAEIAQLIKAGKPADALAKADQRLAANPRDPQLRFLRGVAQADAGKPADAIATFTKLTEEYPELPEPYNNLAVLYANQNQLDKARTALEMAIRTNPSYATAHENLGDIYAKLASQAYNKALQLDATSANSVKPKLALIRELFSADLTGKGVRPAAATAPAAAAPAVVATTRPAPAPEDVPDRPKGQQLLGQSTNRQPAAGVGHRGEAGSRPPRDRRADSECAAVDRAGASQEQALSPPEMGVPNAWMGAEPGKRPTPAAMARDPNGRIRLAFRELVQGIPCAAASYG